MKERRKHISTKAKKLKKSLTEVSGRGPGFELLTNDYSRTRVRTPKLNVPLKTAPKK